MLIFTKAINTIARCTMQYRSEELGNEDISGPQATYLIHISHTPGISQDALAKNIYVNKSNVTRQLINLEENGFIIRKPNDEDQRMFEVYPTEKTTKLMPKIFDVFKTWNDHLTIGLSKEEKEVFFKLLKKVEKNAIDFIDERSREKR